MDDDLVVDPNTGEMLDCAGPPMSAAEGKSCPRCYMYHHTEALSVLFSGCKQGEAVPRVPGHIR